MKKINRLSIILAIMFVFVNIFAFPVVYVDAYSITSVYTPHGTEVIVAINDEMTADEIEYYNTRLDYLYPNAQRIRPQLAS